MPITIQHGVPASSGLPGLAQTEMQTQLQRELAAMPRGGGGWAPRGGGGGGGGGSSVAAGQWAAYNQSRLMEQEAEIEAQQAEHKAGLEAQGLEEAYTTKQRQEIAQYNNAIQRINSSDDFSEEEKVTARRAIELKLDGIEETIMPADPNKMKFPPNQAQSLNETWKNEDGAIMGYDRSGAPKVITEYAKTTEGIREQRIYEQREKLSEFIMEKAAENIGDTLSGPKYRSKSQIRELRDNLIESLGIEDERSEEVGPTPERGDTIFQQMAELQAADQPVGQVADQTESTGFIDLAEQLGVQPNEKEQSLPGDIGAMFAILRTVDERYTGKDGKIDLSKAPMELIQNLEIIEQRAASWLANEQLDRNRQPIPEKKKFGSMRKKIGSSSGVF